MPTNPFGNPFTVPHTQVTSLKTSLPDPGQSLAALMKMQMAQQRMALAVARQASRGKAEKNPFGKPMEVLVPSKDGFVKRVVYGHSAKEREAAAKQEYAQAVRRVIAEDTELQKDLANFSNLSVAGKKEVLEKVRQKHGPRLAQQTGISGEELLKDTVAGLNAGIREREKAINEAGLGTQLLYAGKQIFRNITDAIGAIGETPQQQLARGKANAETAAQDARENAFIDEIQRLEAEGRSSTGFQLENWGKSAVMHATPLAAMMAPAIAGTMLGGPFGAAAGIAGGIAGGAVGAGLPAGGEALARVATDPNLSEAQKEAVIGQTALGSGLTAGAIGAMPIGPASLVRGALAKRAVAKAFPEGVSGAVARHMVPGATAAEKAVAEQAFAQAQAKSWTPNLWQQVGIHGANAAALGGAFQIGSNAAYGLGTGQDVPLTEGLGEAMMSGAILGVPFGIGGRLRSAWNGQRPGLNPNAMPDWTAMRGALGGQPSEGPLPLPSAEQMDAIEIYRQYQREQQRRARDKAVVTPDVIAGEYIAPQPVPEPGGPITREVIGTRPQPVYSWPRGVPFQFRWPLSNTPAVRETPSAVMAGRTVESRRPPRQEYNYGPIEQPAGQSASNALPPGETAEQYAARINQNIASQPRALPDNAMYVADGRVIPMGVTSEALADAWAARTEALQNVRDFLARHPTSTRIERYLKDRLDDNSLNMQDLQALRQEYYDPKKKEKAQSVAVKTLDKVIANGNREPEAAGGRSRQVAGMEPAGRAGKGNADTANPVADSAMPADTPAAAPAAPNTAASETPASSSAVEGRGNVGAAAPDTRQVEAPPAATIEQGAGRTQGSVRERSAEPATTGNAEGGAGQREPQPAPEQRAGNAGNAESANGRFVNPDTQPTPETKQAAVRENKAETPVQDRINPDDTDTVVYEKLTKQIENALKGTKNQASAADLAAINLAMAKTLGDLRGVSAAKALDGVLFSFNKNLNQQVSDDLQRIATFNQRAWHGTPFESFIYKLTTDYLGSGEGAQVHGWGLYVALTEQVAKERYQHRLSAKANYYKDAEFTYKNAPVEKGSLLYDTLQAAGWGSTKLSEVKTRLEAFIDGANDIIEFAKKIGENSPEVQSLLELRRVKTVADLQKQNALCQDLLDNFDQLKMSGHNAGQRLLLEIPEDNVMLREDAKFSAQSKDVQDALVRMADELLPTINSALQATERSDAIENLQWTQRMLSRMKNGTAKDYDGNSIYLGLVDAFRHVPGIENPQREASLALLRHGIEGIRYKGGLDGECAVIFSGDAMRILDRFYDQNGGRGRIDFFSDGTANIIFGNAADSSTAIHEFEHLFLEHASKLLRDGMVQSESKRAQLEKDLTALARWASRGEEGASPPHWSTTTWSVRTHEKIARAFEAYVREGKAPTPELEGIFARMKQLLIQLYQKAKQLIGIDTLPKNIREVFDRQLAGYKEAPRPKAEPVKAAPKVEPRPEIKMEAPQPAPVAVSKPLTEQTYKHVKQQFMAQLEERLRDIGPQKNWILDDASYDNWFSVKDALRTIRRDNQETDAIIERLLEYTDKGQKWEFTEPSEAVAKVEKTVDEALKNPTPENLKAAQEAVEKSGAAISNATGDETPEKKSVRRKAAKKIEEARTVLEEHAKSEDEPPSAEYLAMKDAKLMEEQTATGESEYIAPEDLAIIKNKLWQLATDTENGASTLQSLVGSKKIGKNADGSDKNSQELVNTLTDIYRKFYERDAALTKSETNTYKKLKAWLELQGITEMPLTKGERPANYDELVNDEFIANLHALAEFDKEMLADQAIAQEQAAAERAVYEAQVTPAGIYQKELDTLAKSIAKRFDKIWPGRDKTEGFLNQVKNAFIKKALGEKLTAKEQALYNAATEKGVKALTINKQAVENSVREAHDRGFENYNAIDEVNSSPSGSAEQLNKKPWC